MHESMCQSTLNLKVSSFHLISNETWEIGHTILHLKALILVLIDTEVGKGMDVNKKEQFYMKQTLTRQSDSPT